MRVFLTDAKLRALKPPSEGRVEVCDDNVPGLRLRVSSKGTKTFILRKRQGSKVLNITLGTYCQRFGLANARKKARTLLSDLESGSTPPLPTSRTAGAKTTIRALMPAYLASKDGLRSSGEIRRVAERYILPALGDRLADSVTRGEVTALIDQIGARAPVMARAVHAQLSAFYTWALPRLDSLPNNPCRDAGRPGKPKPRDRVLTNEELRALWRVADKEPSPWGPALKLLMLTGARRAEIFEANRAEFNLQTREWVIPAERAKNGQPHIVPLSSLATRVIEGISTLEGSAKLFPARNNPLNGSSGISRAVLRAQSAMNETLDREHGPHWTLHDIRRTVATGLQRIGIRFEVTEAVLNHVSGAKGGIAGVYQRHDWKAEKRAALDAWATELDQIVSGRESGQCEL